MESSAVVTSHKPKHRPSACCRIPCWDVSKGDDSTWMEPETPVSPHSLQPHSGARTQTKPKGPVRAGCIRKTRGMGAMGGGSDFQKKEGLAFKTAWMKPEDTVLNENSQHGKQTLQELTLCEISEKPNTDTENGGSQKLGERGEWQGPEARDSGDRREPARCWPEDTEFQYNRNSAGELI